LARDLESSELERGNLVACCLIREELCSGCGSVRSEEDILSGIILENGPGLDLELFRTALLHGFFRPSPELLEQISEESGAEFYEEEELPGDPGEGIGTVKSSSPHFSDWRELLIFGWAMNGGGELLYSSEWGDGAELLEISGDRIGTEQETGPLCGSPDLSCSNPRGPGGDRLPGYERISYAPQYIETRRELGLDLTAEPYYPDRETAIELGGLFAGAVLSWDSRGFYSVEFHSSREELEKRAEELRALQPLSEEEELELEQETGS
jgi:hypothetical protein